MSDHLPVYMEIEVVKIAASLDDISFEPSIFYNALQDEVTLKAWPAEEGAILAVEIYDLNGRVVLTQDGRKEQLYRLLP